MDVKLFVRRLFGYTTAWCLLPSSWCKRCHRSWELVQEHSTPYRWSLGIGRGIFALCEDCWSELTPQERLPYYRKLWERWVGDVSWSTIETAVLTEGHGELSPSTSVAQLFKEGSAAGLLVYAEGAADDA